MADDTAAASKRSYQDFREKGDHLPDFLKDFHDQKEFFKAMHERVAVEDNDIAKQVDWITGQVYTIDVFLWWLARHGYTIQKSRARVDFDDLGEMLRDAMARRRDQEREGLRVILSGSRRNDA